MKKIIFLLVLLNNGCGEDCYAPSGAYEETYVVTQTNCEGSVEIPQSEYSVPENMICGEKKIAEFRYDEKQDCEYSYEGNLVFSKEGMSGLLSITSECQNRTKVCKTTYDLKFNKK